MIRADPMTRSALAVLLVSCSLAYGTVVPFEDRDAWEEDFAVSSVEQLQAQEPWRDGSTISAAHCNAESGLTCTIEATCDAGKCTCGEDMFPNKVMYGQDTNLACDLGPWSDCWPSLNGEAKQAIMTGIEASILAYEPSVKKFCPDSGWSGDWTAPRHHSDSRGEQKEEVPDEHHDGEETNRWDWLQVPGSGM